MTWHYTTLLSLDNFCFSLYLYRFESHTQTILLKKSFSLQFSSIKQCWDECTSSSNINKSILDTWTLEIQSMVRDNSLVSTNIAWTGKNTPNDCLVTWEVSGGGLIGNLLTQSSTVELSLWPDTKYRVQVTCKNKVNIIARFLFSFLHFIYYASRVGEYWKWARSASMDVNQITEMCNGKILEYILISCWKYIYEIVSRSQSEYSRNMFLIDLFSFFLSIPLSLTSTSIDKYRKPRKSAAHYHWHSTQAKPLSCFAYQPTSHPHSLTWMMLQIQWTTNHQWWSYRMKTSTFPCQNWTTTNKTFWMRWCTKHQQSGHSSGASGQISQMPGFSH